MALTLALTGSAVSLWLHDSSHMAHIIATLSILYIVHAVMSKQMTVVEGSDLFSIYFSYVSRK